MRRFAAAIVLVLSLLPPTVVAVRSSPPDDSDGGSAEGEAAITPWSGWWWPASEGTGPTLFAANGPLDKYDHYVADTFGESPETRAWERQEVYFPGLPWAGHCNGYAAAALLEPEPTDAVQVLDLTFTVADLKGLLVDYHFGDTATWSLGDENDLNPADFHRMLLQWLRDGEKGFVLTYDLGNGEVWSYPAYKFESTWVRQLRQSTDDDAVWDVTTTVWMADMNVPPNAVGTRTYPSAAGKTFTYALDGNPLSPLDGSWTGASVSGRFAHPGRIWYPDPAIRNQSRGLVSPGLDRQTIANIIAGSDGSEASASPRL